MTPEQIDALPYRGGRRPARFWSKVDRSGGPDACWPWTGGLHAGGPYGALKRRIGGVLVAMGVHVIVCEGRHGPRPPAMEAAHSCNNPPCCNPLHLRWATRQGNADDMVAAGRQASGDRNGSRRHPEQLARGERVSTAKLTETLVATARLAYANGSSITDLARRYNVSIPSMAAALTGRSWAHVAGALSTRPHAKGVASSRAALTREQVLALRLEAFLGTTHAALAARFGISQSTVSLAVRRKRYVNVA